MSSGASEPAPLEDKLSTLLKALATNKTKGNGDSWNGKPEQESLPIRFVELKSGSLEADTDESGAEQPVVEVVTKSVGKGTEGGAAPVPRPADQQESLDDLLQDYVRAVRDARAAGVSRTDANESQETSGVTPSAVAPTEQGTEGTVKALPPVRSAKDYENMSLGELVADLENLVL